MPYGGRTFSADFDFLDHHLYLRMSDGATRAVPLMPRSVADFYAAYLEALRSLGLEVRIRPVPVEVERAIPFAEDGEHASYDAEAANRCWRLLAQADRVLKRFRGRFLGKASPVHFFWGSFDLAATRFSGRPAPPHPGGGLPPRRTTPCSTSHRARTRRRLSAAVGIGPRWSGHGSGRHDRARYAAPKHN